MEAQFRGYLGEAIKLDREPEKLTDIGGIRACQFKEIPPEIASAMRRAIREGTVEPIEFYEKQAVGRGNYGERYMCIITFVDQNETYKVLSTLNVHSRYGYYLTYVPQKILSNFFESIM